MRGNRRDASSITGAAGLTMWRTSLGAGDQGHCDRTVLGERYGAGADSDLRPRGILLHAARRADKSRILLAPHLLYLPHISERGA